MSIAYLCAACGEIVDADAKVELIDSGTTIACSKCGGLTVFDLSTPETRAQSYQLVEALSQAAGFAGPVDAETMRARVEALHQRISSLMDEVLRWRKRAEGAVTD